MAKRTLAFARYGPQTVRRDSGYRDYGTADLHWLGFIRHARDLGFSLERIKVLLGLWSDPSRSNADVKAIAKAHIQELELRARQLNEMAGALRALANACEGDGRPDCPIIASLETGTAPEGPCRALRLEPAPCPNARPAALHIHLLGHLIATAALLAALHRH